ncbi:MAG: DUF4395 family protein [Bacteroidota bacterium]
MKKKISDQTLHRLDVQGFDTVPVTNLSAIAPWNRMAFAGCALLAGLGTSLASPVFLYALMPIAALAAIFPVHPFDLIYNHFIRYIRQTGPIPKRGTPSRVTCGTGVVWLGVTALCFQQGALLMGYIRGGTLTAMATLVALTDICIPSMVYRAVFAQPITRKPVNS